MVCEDVRGRLMQYVADGEPRSGSYDDVRRHLLACAECRELVGRARRVEAALRRYPLSPAAPGAAEAIVRHVRAHGRARQEEWHLLPWDVWVPVLALLAAILVVSLSLPGRPLAAGPEVGRAINSWPALMEQLGTTLVEISESLLWSLVFGLCAAMAGLGISLALAHWTPGNSRSLQQLEERVGDAATWLWHRARGAG